MPINFKIVTPQGIAYEDEIKQVTIPTASGEITVLANHTPIVTLLRYGEMVALKEADNKERSTGGERFHKVRFAVSRGVVEVKQGSEVVILADSADRAEEIDMEAASAARRRAEKMLEEKETLSDVEFSRFQTILDRELNKLKIGGKYGGK